MTEPLDTIAPWTIKAVSTQTRKAVTTAAQKEGVTVGQWLDKRVAEWLEDGQPTHIAAASSQVANSVNPVALMEMLANMGRAGVTVQKGVGSLANRLVKRTMQEALRQAPARPVALLAAPPQD